MSMCAVDGKEFGAWTGLKTWGQLLDALEQGAGPDRTVVTAVRFRGVDQPSFREPEFLIQDLQASAPIEVETCQARVLLDEAIEACLNGLGPLSLAAQQTADAFRSHDIGDAHTRLTDLVATLQALTKLMTAVGLGDLTPRPERPGADAALLDQMGQILESLIEAATNQDWISVADILEYDLADLLPQWRDVLRDLASPESGAEASGSLPVPLRCAS